MTKKISFEDKFGWYIKALVGVFLLLFIPAKLNMNLLAVGLGYLIIGIIVLGVSGWLYWRDRK